MERKTREELITQILDAVITCKSNAGGVNVPLAQIACQAGVSERTLSRYFPDSELLCYDAAIKYLRDKYDGLAKQYDLLDKRGLNGLKRLLLLARTAVDNLRTDIPSALIFVRAFTTAMRTAVYRKLPPSGFDAATRDIVLCCARDGMADGSIRRDVAPVDVYLMLSSNFHGLLQRTIYMYSLDQTETEHQAELLLVFHKYLEMFEQYLSTQGSNHLPPM